MVRRGEAEKHGKRIGQRVAVGEGPRLMIRRASTGPVPSWIAPNHPYGLPATTRERTIADLVEDRQDLSTVADALRDATRQSALDIERLTELLAPLARRNGCAAGDGAALLEKLARSAGIDEDSWARRIAENGPLMAKILSQHIAHPSPKMQEPLNLIHGTLLAVR